MFKLVFKIFSQILGLFSNIEFVLKNDPSELWLVSEPFKLYCAVFLLVFKVTCLLLTRLLVLIFLFAYPMHYTIFTRYKQNFAQWNQTNYVLLSFLEKCYWPLYANVCVCLYNALGCTIRGKTVHTDNLPAGTASVVHILLGEGRCKVYWGTIFQSSWGQERAKANLNLSLWSIISIWPCFTFPVPHCNKRQLIIFKSNVF